MSDDKVATIPLFDMRTQRWEGDIRVAGAEPGDSVGLGFTARQLEGLDCVRCGESGGEMRPVELEQLGGFPGQRFEHPLCVAGLLAELGDYVHELELLAGGAADCMYVDTVDLVGDLLDDLKARAGQ